MAKEPIRSLSVRLKGMHWFPGLGGGAGERGSASLLSRSGGALPPAVTRAEPLVMGSGSEATLKLNAIATT